jgi:hypothetical protein
MLVRSITSIGAVAKCVVVLFGLLAGPKAPIIELEAIKIGGGGEVGGSSPSWCNGCANATPSWSQSISDGVRSSLCLSLCLSVHPGSP